MNSKHIKVMACAAALCGSVSAFAEATADEQAGFNWKLGEGITYDEKPIVSTEVALAFDSKFLSYGLVDNNDPILTPSASMTFFDTFNIGVASIFDISRYGKAAGYGDRAWQYQELDPEVGLTHAFSSDDYSWLPTTVELSLGYLYEHHPKVVDDDTQFVNLSVSLPDLWLVPTLSYERDVDRDNGSYLLLELSHEFEITESVGFTVTAGQGWGDANRIDAYLETERSGLMDFSLTGELSWEVTDGVTLCGYVAYTDYLFDSSLRERARNYEATGHWKESWNFTAGCSLAVNF